MLVCYFPHTPPRAVKSLLVDDFGTLRQIGTDFSIAAFPSHAAIDTEVSYHVAQFVLDMEQGE